MSGLAAYQWMNLKQEGRPDMNKLNVEVGKNKNDVLPPTQSNLSFPSNSNRSRQTIPEKKKLDQVTQGRVEKVKKSPGRRISETFLADDANNVWNYVFINVIVPNVKLLVSDMGKAIVDGLIYGRNSSSLPRRAKLPGSRVSYGDFYKDTEIRDLGTRPLRRVRQNFEDILLNSREEAEQVLTILVEMIDTYGSASLAEFYDLVGIETTHVDYKYGWESLNRAGIVRKYDGYVINLPHPIILN